MVSYTHTFMVHLAHGILLRPDQNNLSLYIYAKHRQQCITCSKRRV